MNKPELLAPAGNLEKLQYALAYGADAVYLGNKNYSLRAAAGNFNLKELKKAVRIAHGLEKKVYLTINIFAQNEDLISLKEYLLDIKNIGIDALIISDPGIFKITNSVVPQIPIHLSVQSNITNLETALFWKELGVKRVTLARELTLDNIKIISENVDIETEIFVHGAMCIAYSGRCLISRYFTRRDANRGNCAQSCRWKYYLLEEERPGIFCLIEEAREGTYLFNSKDLCLLSKIPELIQTGIDSFKIEGRMKSLHYLVTVVNAYRQVIDQFIDNPEKIEVSTECLKEMEKIDRRGYTEGFISEDLNMENYEKDIDSGKVEYIGLVNNDCPNEVLVKNMFSKGDQIECIWPSGGREIVNVDLIQNCEDLEEIEVANPNMRVIINNKDFPHWALLRKI